MYILRRIKILAGFLSSFFKTTGIKAVYEDDLPTLLTSLGISESIERGEFKCSNCGRVVTNENLWGILRSNKKLHLICSDPECTRVHIKL